MIRIRRSLCILLSVSILGVGQASASAPTRTPVASKKACHESDVCRRAVAWHKHQLAEARAAVRWQRREAAKARLAARVVTANNLTPLEVGRALAQRAGWTGRQWVCLVELWSRESGWVPTKSNYAGSGAYGIPQALPGSKMANMGADWRTNAATQIRWGLRYIKARYGAPCGALAQSNRHGWY